MNAYLIAALLALAGVGVAYLKGRQDGQELEKGQQAQVELAVVQTRKAALDATAEAIAKIETRTTIVRQQLGTVTRENVVYRDCQHTPDGLRLLNSILTGGNGAESPSAEPVSRADSAPRSELRSNDGQAGGSSNPVSQVQSSRSGTTGK